MKCCTTQQVPYPYECPDCGIEAGVIFRGKTPALIPDSHCSHAVHVHREGARVVVTFAIQVPRGQIHE
jgi:hypothetical protein